MQSNLYIQLTVVFFFLFFPSGIACYSDNRLFQSADMDVRVYSFANLYHLHVSNSFKALESPFSLKVVESQRDLSITGAKTVYGMTSCITGANKNNLEFQITT